MTADDASIASGLERDRARIRELVDDSLNATAVCELLGCSDSELAARALFVIEVDDRRLYPRWQFDPSQRDGVIAGLRQLLEAFAFSRLEPIDQTFWLTTTQPFFDWERPLDWLRRGDWEAVAQSARGAGWR